jgi:purine-binding chemotaxis protein CheW
MLLCRIRTHLCGLPVEQVIETMRPMPIRSLADSPPYILGLSVIRGNGVPVIDGGRLFKDAADPAHTSLILLKVGSRQVGLMVEQVVGIGHLPDGLATGLTPLARQTCPEVVQSLSLLEGDLVYLLQTARLITEPVWRQLARGGSLA